MSSMKNRRPRRTPVFQINAKVFSRYSHPVKEKALHTVVSITALEEIVPSCPMLRAMLKQLTVVGELSISKTAVSTSPRQPSQTASGKNSTAKTNSLKILLTTAGFQQPAAFFGSILAPSAKSPSGVAVAARLLTARCMMTGCGILKRDQSRPMAMLKMIGLVAMPLTVFPKVFRSRCPPLGAISVRITTAATL